MSDETIGQVNSVKVDRWGTGDRNDCYWNIAANQLGEGASAQEIQALCEQLQQYNKEKNTAIQNQGELLMDGDQVFIPLEYAIDEIQTNITAKQEEVTTAQENLSTAQSDLSDANGAVTSTLEAYQSAASAYNGAAEDADNKDGLKAAMDAAKQEYLNAVKAQQAAQEAVETAKGEVETKKTELEAYGTQLEELKTELSEEEENYQEQLNQLDEQIANIDANIQETETSIQQAEAQQQAAAQQQEDAANLGVTEDADGNLTLDDSEITDEQLSGALQSSKDITALADYTNKEVSSQEISEDGNTKTVEFADGTSVKYTKNEETGEWEAMPTTVYDEDGDEIVASEAGETQDEDAGSDEEDINAESSKEEILSHLDENAPDDVEFEQQEDGTYTAEYITSENVSGPETRTKSVVEYDPETGVTTVRRYDVTNNENDEIQEDQEPSSITEYNENTNTETFTYTSTRYRTGEDPETVEEVYTTVYADDSMSDEAITRISKEENGNLTLVTTKQDGEITGRYAVEYDGENISEFTIKDANGTQQTFSIADLEALKDASGNQITSSQIEDIMVEIQNGESPKTAFKNIGGDELLNYIAENNIQLGAAGTRNDTEYTTYAVDEAAGLCLPNVSDFQLSGKVEEEDGIYTMTYKGTMAINNEESQEVTYQAVYDPETGITTFSALDEEGNPTEETHMYDSKNLTKESKNADGSVEFSKYSYGENDEGALERYEDSILVGYDDNEAVSNIMITDSKGSYVTLEASDLEDAGIDQSKIDEIFTALSAGANSPRAILETYFPGGSLDDLLLSDNNDEESTAAFEKFYGASESTLNIENFEEEFNQHIEDGTLHEYLINNVTSENLMDIVLAIESNEDDGGFSMMTAMKSMDSGNEYDLSVELLANIMSNVDIDELKENGQYETYINFVANECNANLDLYTSGTTTTKTAKLADILIANNSLDDTVILDIANALHSVNNAYLSQETRDKIEDIAIQYLTSTEISAAGDSTTLASKAEDILIQRLNAGNTQDIIQEIIDKDNNEYDAALVNLASKYSEKYDNESLMRKFETNRDLCLAYADRLINQFSINDSSLNNKLAKILANDLYQAMEGANSRENMLDAILGNNDNGKSRISKEYISLIEDAFNNANYKNTKLWQYIDSQWSIGGDRKKEYKQYLDKDWSNE